MRSATAALFGTDIDVGQGISDMLVTALVNDGTYSVIEREMLDRILDEQDFANSGRCQWQSKTAHFWQLKTAHFREATPKTDPRRNGVCRSTTGCNPETAVPVRHAPNPAVILRRLSSEVGTLELIDVDAVSSIGRILAGTGFQIGDLAKTVTN